MDERRILDVKSTLWIYQSGDYAYLSDTTRKAWCRSKEMPERQPEFILRLVLSTDFQLLGMHYKKPELQQLAISLLNCETNLHFSALSDQALAIINDIQG